MKNLSILILCSLILSGYVIAQNAENNDPAAQKILDQLSKETKSYKSIKATFTYTLENKKENSKVAQDGSLLLKGDKYKLEIAGQEIKKSPIPSVLKIKIFFFSYPSTLFYFFGQYQKF